MLVGGASPAFLPIPATLADSTSGPPAPTTSELNHTEEALLALSLSPTITLQPLIVASQFTIARTGNVPHSLPTASVTVPRDPSRPFTSTVVQGSFKSSLSTAGGHSYSLLSSFPTLPVSSCDSLVHQLGHSLVETFTGPPCP